MAGKKSTNAELAERIDLTGHMIIRGFRKSEIKKVLREKYGSISGRMIEIYMARARAEILKQAGTSKEEKRAESYEYYRRIDRDKNATVADKIRARTRQDQLYGLDAPVRQEISGCGGAPIATEDRTAVPALTKPQVLALIELTADVGRSIENGNGHSNGNGKADGCDLILEAG